MNVTTLDQTVYVITNEDGCVTVTTQQDINQYLEDVIAGTNISIDKSNPKKPRINASAASATWGSITGTLSDQTDLQSALNAKQDLVTRVSSVTSSATVTLNCDSYDMLKVTAQAEALIIANPTGTPTEGQMIVYRIKDNGTARALSFGNQFRSIGFTLPTTTVLGKTMYIPCVRNFTDTKWDVINVVQET